VQNRVLATIERIVNAEAEGFVGGIVVAMVS
jgi:hypothetical protein